MHLRYLDTVWFHNSAQSSCCKMRRGVSIKVKSCLDGYYFRWQKKILRNFIKWPHFFIYSRMAFAKNKVSSGLENKVSID